jgi:hypothetical protein
VIYSGGGGYSKGLGRVRYNTTPINTNPINTVIAHYRPDGSIKRFYASGTTLWIDNGVSLDAITNSTGVVIVFASTKFDHFSWVDDKLYLVNGDKYYKVSYSAVNSRWECEEVSPKVGADLTGVKRCNIHEYYSGWFRHFFAGDKLDRLALWYSEDNDPTNVLSGPSGVKKVYPTANLGPIMGVKSFRNQVLVGYKHGWFRWQGGGVNPAVSADWHQVKASSGPVSNRAIVPVGDTLLYASGDGIYLLENLDTYSEDNSRKISRNINNIYSKLVNKHNMCAIFDGRFLFLGCCDGTVQHNNMVIVVDFDVLTSEENGEYVPSYSIFPNCYAGDFMLIDGIVYYAHSNNGLIMRFDSTSYNDDGLPMKMRAQHFIILPDGDGDHNPYIINTVRSLFYAAMQPSTNSSVTISLEFDGYTSKSYTLDEIRQSFKWGEDWGKNWGSAEYITKEVSVNHKARRLKVTIENNGLGEMFSLLSFAFKYRSGKMKGGN